MRLVIVFILILSLPGALAISWSEMLPDPDGRDDGKEFVELVGGMNLSGCTIQDGGSSDILDLLWWDDGEIILIVESDGLLNATPGATIYGAGKAIGNGLGNTQDSLSILCNGTQILTTTYDVAAIEGYVPGASITYSGGWHAGEPGGSPGIITEDIMETVMSDNATGKGGGAACNNTLLMTVSATSAAAGDIVHFTILSEGYASFEAFADGAAFAYGDTLTTREHWLQIPDSTEIKLVARAERCGAEQRATRLIAVSPPQESEIVGRPSRNETLPVQNIAGGGEEAQHRDGPPEAADIVPKPRVESAPVPAGRVILDTDTNVVPWVSAFGMVTVLVSAGLFRGIMKKEGK